MADVTVLGSMTSVVDSRGMISPVRWVSTGTGYVITHDGTTFVCLKTTDSGASWSEVDAAGAKAANPRSQGFGIEAELASPNDADAMHCCFLDVDDDELQKLTFDIGAETWGSIATIDTVPVPDGVSNSSSQSACDAAVNEGGDILGVWRANENGEVGAGLWDESAGSGSSVDGGDQKAWWGTFQVDQVVASAANGGADFMTVMLDESTDDFRLRGYRVAAAGWSGNTSINGFPVQTGRARSGHQRFAIVYDHVNDQNILIANTDTGASGNDIRCWTITWDGSSTAPTVAAESDVITNNTTTDVMALSIDYVNEKVYAQYSRGTIGSLTDIFWKTSDLATISWSAESSQYNTTTDDYRMISKVVIDAVNGGRIMPVFFDQDDLLLLVNDGNDVEIAPTSAVPVVRRLETGNDFGPTAARLDGALAT